MLAPRVSPPPWRAVLTAWAVCGLFAARPASADESAVPDLELLRKFRAEFVALTPGKDPFPDGFTRGRDDGPPEERPAQRVVLRHALAMARYEVPQDLWRAVMGNNPSRWQGRRNAVEMVSFDDAQTFCRRITGLLLQHKLIEADETVRLPTEVEWEYAARAGSQTRYSFGDDAGSLGDFAWYHGNAAGNDPPVGAKRANAWGLYDMHGYLWEWCADAWHADHRQAGGDDERPRAGDGGDEPRRVLRGGSWKDGAEALTSTARRGAAADFKDDAVGFRCVLSKRDFAAP